MKPTEKIEEFVKLEKPHVTTGGEMDKRTLNDSFAAMDKTIRSSKQNAAGMILRSKAAKLAAAAVIFVAVSLLMIYRNPPAPQQPPRTVSIKKSPTEMQSMLSLNIAYRRGGLGAVDRQYKTVVKMLGSRPAEITIEQMLAEFNGT